jgi:hypothetical protein
MTNLTDLYVSGVPTLGAGGGLPTTQGKYIFVDYTLGSDSNNGESMGEPVKTIAQAYSIARTNKEYGIVLMGSATHTLTSMLTVAKNRVHFVGLDASGGRLYGQNAKISLGATTAATDIATITNTGVRNSFHNIKFMNSNTVAQGIWGFAEAGEFAVYENCEFYKSTDLETSISAELLCNGDSAQFRRCTFGSTANARSGAVIRPCVMLTRETIAGKVSRDVTFEDCQFWIWCGNTANAFVWATTATDVERKMEFKNCLFYSDVKSTATPAVAVGGAAALTAGRIVLSGTTAEVGCTALATQTGIWSALPTLAAAGGSALQAT